MSNIRKNIVTGFEIILMVVQFSNIYWMTRFVPSNIAEWIINFAIFVYVFSDAWYSWYRRKNR